MLKDSKIRRHMETLQEVEPARVCRPACYRTPTGPFAALPEEEDLQKMPSLWKQPTAMARRHDGMLEAVSCETQSQFFNQDCEQKRSGWDSGATGILIKEENGGFMGSSEAVRPLVGNCLNISMPCH